MERVTRYRRAERGQGLTSAQAVWGVRTPLPCAPAGPARPEVGTLPMLPLPLCAGRLLAGAI